MLSCILGRQNHAVDAPLAEAAGNDDAVQLRQRISPALLSVMRLGVDPLDSHLGAQCIARVAQRLGHGKIGVVQLDILAHKTDVSRACPRVFDALHHVLPFGQIRRRGVDPQLPADDGGEVGLFQHQAALHTGREA